MRFTWQIEDLQPQEEKVQFPHVETFLQMIPMVDISLSKDVPTRGRFYLPVIAVSSVPSPLPTTERLNFLFCRPRVQYVGVGNEAPNFVLSTC